MRSFVLMIVTLFLAGCGASASGDSGPGGTDPVAVRIEQAFDRNGALYIEGSYSYVRVERPDGEQVLDQRLPSDFPVASTTFRLDPGSYRLLSYQRPCAGNCGLLDPPTDRCDAALAVEVGSPLEVSVRVSPGEGCAIDVAAG
jgi:hypothetical protein